MPDIIFTAVDGVAVITVDNVEIRNGLTSAMSRRLEEICGEIDNDISIGATVIQGAGGTFCSGADTRSWKGEMLSDEGFENVDVVYRSFRRFGALATPTIAAVRGTAVGAGMNLALSADLRIVGENTRFIGGFLKIGIHPGGGFFSLVGRSAGREAAAAMGLFSEDIIGQQAVERGLAWQAVPDEEVEARALEFATRAARDPVLARRAVKSLRTELGPQPISWDAAIEVERGVQLWSLQRFAERKAKA